ncbi:MAG: serpin family protein [Bacteroidales bacterium]|nr:serpin family protein [Bacteroidales bacterium]
MMKVKTLILSALLVMTGCTNNSLPDEPTPAQPAEEEQPVSDELSFRLTPEQSAVNASINRSTFGLLADCYATDPGKNMSVSPVSVSICLGMIANSVDDNTAAAIAESLGYTDLKALNGLCSQLLTYLPAGQHGAELLIANSVWHDSRLPVADTYTKMISETFKSDVIGADFEAPATVDLINSWCADHTKGKIDKIIDEINGSIYWINALYFAGMWEVPFDKSLTRKADFTTPDGIREVDMMHLDLQCAYSHNDIYRSVDLGFKGGNTILRLYLPARGVGIESLLASIDSDPVIGGNANLHLDLPRFDVNTFLDMTGILERRGISLQNVWPSKMGLDASAPMRFKHNTTTTVDEDGATVAAVSFGNWAVDVPDSEAPVDLTLTFDRPFVYTVTNRITGSCIMAGVVTNP